MVGRRTRELGRRLAATHAARGHQREGRGTAVDIKAHTGPGNDLLLAGSPATISCGPGPGPGLDSVDTRVVGLVLSSVVDDCETLLLGLDQLRTSVRQRIAPGGALTLALRCVARTPRVDDGCRGPLARARFAAEPPAGRRSFR